MQKIHFVRNPESVRDLESKGYTVYPSGQTPRDGLVETVNGEAPSLLKLLQKFGADPLLQDSRIKIPECVTDEQADLLVDWCRTMGFSAERVGNEIIGDQGGISKLSIRFADMRRAANTGASFNAIGA
jgi:hypothetical protein